MNVQVAKFDADGVYWGLEEKPLAEVKSGDVVFNAETFEHDEIAGVIWMVGGCDNAGGRYIFNRQLHRFEPLARHHVKDAPDSPLFERALYELVLEHVRAGAPRVPDYTKAWALHYETTMDYGKRERPLAMLLKS